MKLGSRRALVPALGMVIVCVMGVASAGAQAAGASQAASAQKPVMAEDVLKNVQVLRGIPLDEFMGTMGFFAAALSLNCTDCHVGAALDNWERYADDTPRKQTTRKMILMVRMINQASFGGKREVTCYTCHRSSDHPKVTPSLAEQYGTPPPDDPDEIESPEQAVAPGAPSADQILDRYIQALGGAQRLANLTSFVAKGTYSGYDTSDAKVPVEVYVKAPSQRTTVAHVPVGDSGAPKDSTTTFDGRAGWISTPNTLVPMLALTGGNLDGAKVDADLSFPGRIKQALTNWRAGFPEVSIDDHDVQVIQGTSGGKSLVKLYFDKKSGLLVRQVRYADTVVGLNPTQVDYSDYRDVSGVKLPFRWTVTWTDGLSSFEMKEVQPNVPIDPSKFAKPRP
jgi:photosynthetic reaction center cytochrome c subunit